MSVLTLSLDTGFDTNDRIETKDKEEMIDEASDDFDTSMDTISKKKPPKMARLRSPSFEGYFASQSGAYAWQSGNTKLKPNAEKFEEIQAHLEKMIGLLREIDVLRMAVRIESRVSSRKRYMTVITDDLDHSAIIGIDWTNESGPTIGLVLPIWSTTVTLLDGDGGLSVSRTRTRNYFFKPVSVQTLWSARQVIDKATQHASHFKYYEGVSTNGFLEYYQGKLSSDILCLEEWHEMDDLSSHAVEILTSLQQSRMQEDGPIREKISTKLREIMRKVDLDEVSCKQLRLLCEKDLGMNLSSYKQYIDQEVLVIMGQMDSATQMLDYLYLGSEWNASNLAELKEFGVGYILNITREVDNFFPQSFVYYNIRVLDVEETELLKHWDHTYRFIEKARQESSKVLVHCRYGISRSASTVIAYLMKKKGWSMQQALNYVVERRSIVQPNPSFQNQLIVYDGILNSSRNRFSSLFHQRTLKLAEEKERRAEQSTADQRRKRFKSSRTSSHDIGDQVHAGNRLEDFVDGNYDDENIDESNKENVFPENNVRRLSSNISEDYGKIEEAVLIEPSTTPIHPPPLTADMSFCEEMEVEEFRQLRRQSTAHKARLMRAKTMRTGAVFFDEEDSSDCDSASNRANASSNEENSVLTDPDEDKLMEQVVMATQMKNELIRSVQKLQSDSMSESGDDISLKVETDEYNIKPSLLRKMSHVSALLHFENLAKMKRRKSLTESQLKEIIEAEDEDKKIKPVSKNNVASISEMFIHRSKKHVLDYARRRTMNDDSMMDFDIRTARNLHYFPAEGKHAKSTSSLPVFCHKTKYIEPDKGSGDEADDEELITISMEKKNKQPKSSTSLNRSSSLNTRRPSDKKPSVDYDNDSDRLSVEALDLDRSFQDEARKSARIEIKVSELVNYHNRLIREESISKLADEMRPSPVLDNNIELISEDVADGENTEKSVSTRRCFKRTNLFRVKRVQSFPRMKKDDSFCADANDGNISSLESEESQSLPSSPEFSRRTENYRDVTKHTIMAYLTMDKHERPEKDVRSIVKKFEQQDFSKQQKSKGMFKTELKENPLDTISSQSVA